LDGDLGIIRIQFGESLVFGNPAAENLLSQHELAGLVVELKDDVLAKVLKRDLRAEAGPEVPHLVGPSFKFDVLRHASFERDGGVL